MAQRRRTTGQPGLYAAFHQGLKDAGFIEGQNLAIEYRSANRQMEQLPAQGERAGELFAARPRRWVSLACRSNRLARQDKTNYELFGSTRGSLSEYLDAY